MNKFNLTFKGEIIPGKDPKRTKLRFGELFGIDDPARLEHYFSGETFVLHGNLERKSAAEFYSKLKQLGVVTELVSVNPKKSSATAPKAPARSESIKPTPADSSTQEKKRTTQSRGTVGKSWAVSSSRRSRKTPDTRVKKAVVPKQAMQAEERKAAKQTTIRKAEPAAKQERQAQEAARKEALRQEAGRQAEEQKRKKADEVARRKALHVEARRKAEAQKRKKAEAAARRKALREEAKRKAEEAARQKAIQEEAKRKAEEVARQQAIQEEAKRKAEEAARQQAIQEAAKRKAEEAARQQAIQEEAKRKAEEVARQQAIQEEAKRKAEEAARQQAIQEEAKRKAEEAARQKAIQEKAKRKAEEAARRKALREKAKRKAEEVARKKAIRKEAKRQAIEEKRRKAREAAKREAEDARKKLQAAEEAARQLVVQQESERKAAREHKARQEEQRREAAANAARVKARLTGPQEKPAAQRKAMEDLAVHRAAQELTRQPSLKPVNGRIKTKLEIPPGKSDPAINPEETATKGRNRPGEPNLYSLRPFRNTPQVKARAKQCRARFRTEAVIAGLALACLFIAGGFYLSLPPIQNITGADSLALAPGSGPVLLAGEHLLIHDRAGVGTQSMVLQDLGLQDLAGPMVFNARGELLALGHLDSAGSASAEHGTRRLLRCNLEDRRCLTFSSDLAKADIASFVVHPLTGMLFLADAQAGQLLKTSSEGTLVRSADTAIPEHPVMRLESGLLFMNSASGPAISVLRYDDKAFGEQLDEILILPEPAISAGQTRVWDFARTESAWWVTLYNPDTNRAGVYRFDEQWNYMEHVELAPGTRPEQLASWGSRMLVRDPRHIPIQRFNARGEPEAPLVSDLLQNLVTAQQGTAKTQGLAWQTGLVLLALICAACTALASVHQISSLVYRPHRERGAEPIDEQGGIIRWVAPVPDRAAQILRTGMAYAALALLLLSLAIIQRVSLVQLTALLLALGGPVIALVLLRKSPVGHIGILDGQLLLADHTGMYHLGRDARLQYRGPFLLVDDVVVFTGTRRLPAFSPQKITGEVAALARAGIKVDRKTVMIKLLQCRHPLARGASVTIIGLVLAVTLLALPL